MPGSGVDTLSVTSQDLFLMSNGWKITLDPFLKGREG